MYEILIISIFTLAVLFIIVYGICLFTILIDLQRKLNAMTPEQKEFYSQINDDLNNFRYQNFANKVC